MPAERKLGMDHEHHDWSPISTRTTLRWPDDARIALCVIVNLEKMEWSVPDGSYEAADLAGGQGPMATPDFARVTHREYGHRVGIFRVLDTLEANGIKATIAMDALTAENYPYLVEHCQKRGCEIIAHGISASQMITSQMSEAQEREYIQRSIDSLTRATGSAPVGWFGPEYGESARTPQLLAQAGIRYVCDWTNDEQPYQMKVPQGTLTSLPVMLELDDVYAHWSRRVEIDRYAAMLEEAMDTMYRDASESGRLMVLNLHPWLIGQPFRIGFLNDALRNMTRRQGVWAATGSEITDWFQSNQPGI